MKTNVFCYAKKDLKAGEFLDGMGGFASYGLIENLEDQKEEGPFHCGGFDCIGTCNKHGVIKFRKT